MTKKAFAGQERTLQAEFFRQVDEELVADIQSKLGGEKEIAALGEATGFTDQQLLKELIALGLSPETVLAVSLVPMILVAWADGKVDGKERSAIFEAAKEQGITDGSPAAKMMKHWLKSEPDRQLALTWMHYVQKITNEMDGEAILALRDDFDRRTRAIAHASGGVLGFGKVSEVEKSAVADLRQAFDV